MMAASEGVKSADRVLEHMLCEDCTFRLVDQNDKDEHKDTAIQFDNTEDQKSEPHYLLLAGDKVLASLTEEQFRAAMEKLGLS